jgi:hypothetical protein
MPFIGCYPKASSRKIKARGGFKELKPMRGESEETHHATGNNVYYMLTLNPSVKDHRVIALLIDYTSEDKSAPSMRQIIERATVASLRILQLCGTIVRGDASSRD